jgi:hypothetical protein
MTVTPLFVFLTVAGLATGIYVSVQNTRLDTVWIGIKGINTTEHPESGGFALGASQTVSTGLEIFGG